MHVYGSPEIVPEHPEKQDKLPSPGNKVPTVSDPHHGECQRTSLRHEIK